MALRVMLILVILLTLYGCDQSSPPPAQSEKEDLEQLPVRESEEREEHAEASCRMVFYSSNEDMSQQEAAAFSERVANEIIEDMEGDPSLTLGSAEDAALNQLDVPRYQQCER
jgi:hypothetical protein